jgi:hypothetical protein
VVRSFDDGSFRRALSIPGTTRVAAGVVVLPGSPPAGEGASLGTVGAGPQSPWLPVWEAALVLAIAWAAGWPISALLVPAESHPVRAALAPACGFAALMLASVLVDGIGLHLSDAGGWVALALATVPAWAVLVLRPRRRPVAA